MTLNAAMMTSARGSWNTPGEVLELVRKVGRIYLDPCSNPESIVEPTVAWSLEDGQNGLTLPWTVNAGKHLIYVNPEYGKEIAAWLKKCHQEAAAGAQIIALLPSRTDARWFDYVWCADAVCFWRGRLKFLGAPSSAPFPNVVAYWGSRPHRFADVFSAAGRVVMP